MTILLLIIALLSLVVLMVIHEFGHFIIAKKFGVRVDEFGIGYPPRIFGKKIGETIYSVNLLPLGAFVKIYGEEGGVDDCRSFTNLKIWKRILIIIGGVAAFWLAAIIIFSVLFGLGADLPVGDQDAPGLTNARVEVFEVSPNSPAKLAGFQAGDVILQLAYGKKGAQSASEIIKINKIQEFQDFAKSHVGEEITATVQRKGKTIDLFLTPRANPPQGQGAVGVGLERLATLIKKYPFYLAPIHGIKYTWQTTANAILGLGSVFSNLFGGKGLPKGAEFAGPLGITVFLANAASYGVGFFLYFIGSIAVFVAIFNLFPIPALDGGKLIFLLIEKIRGKPVSAKVEQNITIVFFVLLITLSLFITIRFDIPRFADFLKSAFSK